MVLNLFWQGFPARTGGAEWANVLPARLLTGGVGKEANSIVIMEKTGSASLMGNQIPFQITGSADAQRLYHVDTGGDGSVWTKR